jgi:heat shock protein HtpX
VNDAATSTRSATRLQRLSDQEALRLRQAFINDVSGGTGVYRGQWRSVAAAGLAGLVLGFYAVVLFTGLWSVWSSYRSLHSNGVQVVVWAFAALCCLGFCWLARPHFGARPEPELTAAQAPELHALIAEVAQRLGAPVPYKVRIYGEVNAFVTREGFPPRFSLTLGLPFMFGLHPQERLDLIAHELAHEVNGDPARGQLVAAAMRVLWTLKVVLYPEDSRQMGLLGIITNALRWLLVLPIEGLVWLFEALIGEERQRAEFRADLMAASVAGSAAAVSGMDKLHFSNLLEFALQKQKTNPERPHAFLELRHAWDHLSPEQWERQRQQVAQERLRLDQSHPPTADRLAVLAHHALPAALLLTPERAARIEAELTPFVKGTEAEAYEDYRRRYSA